MRYLFTLVVCLSVVTSVTFAQDEQPETPQQEKEPPYKSVTDQASYTYGQNLAAHIKYNDAYSDLNFDVVIEGFVDKLKDKEPKMTERQMQEAVKAYERLVQAKLVEKRKAAADKNKQEGAKFLAENAKKAGVKTTASGLQYEVIKEGKGQVNPKPTDTVTTHYHGTLIDGTVFDSSVDRGQPIDFRVNQVIDGWTEALQLMNVGDKFKLYIPSDLAYGERGAGQTIGPNSTLIFEVELLGINGKTE